MWDIETGEEIRPICRAHAGNTFGIDITSKTAPRLLTTSSDTTVRMWDIASGEEINRFEQHGDWIQEIVLGSRTNPLAISAWSGLYVLRRWRIKRLSADGLIEWARGNRYIRELTCAERQSYRLDCESWLRNTPL